MEMIHLNDEIMAECYYKFRSLQNTKRFLDILINERLYASRYDELNDPMEGAYLTDDRHRHIIELLRVRKYNTRICSLSKDYKHTLLWSHYADGHQGCCIGVSVKNNSEKATEVQYVEHVPVIYDDCEGTKLLSHKSTLWRYENEVRYFRKTSYLNVNIHQVIFGYRVSDDDFKFYKKLILRIIPEINVRKIEQCEIINGFDNYT